MDYRILFLASCLLVLALSSIAIISYLTIFLVRNWEKIQPAKLVWRNKYPSFDELHALFDRGDVMLACVQTASTLQLLHPGLRKVLKAHSTYTTNPWRRTIRTMAFMYIMIRSNSKEREQVIAWLQRLHRPIRLFEFDTNVLVFSTFAYALVKTHELLGTISPEKAELVVKGVMSMADKLDAKDKGRKVPNTMAEVETYLETELSIDIGEALKVNTDFSNLVSIRARMKKQGFRKYVWLPFTLVQLAAVKHFAWTLSHTVLAQRGDSQLTLGSPFWWCVRKAHCFFSHFHYTMCPRVLTFDGTLDLMVAGNPGLENVLLELHAEIFGNDSDDAPAEKMPGQTLRHFSHMKAHLPRMEIDKRSAPSAPVFRHELVELVTSSYYRGVLTSHAPQLPQHLGVIMDGNRRYSRHNGLGSVLAGHEVGAQKLLQVVTWSLSAGVQNLTVWALSDDNLKRGPQELSPLFAMMADYIRETMMGDAPFSIPDIRLRVVGDRSILPDDLNDIIIKAEAATAHNTKFNLQLALGYGGRSEIKRATKLAAKVKMAEEGISLEEAMENMTDKEISSQMYSAQLGLPHIDAIMRTSGENRLSGFALWESHHAEFLIFQENWPALPQSTFLKGLLDLSKRNRRLGA